MPFRLIRSVLLLVTVVAFAGMSASAQEEPRQYYTAWQKHPKANYYFSTYNYKPTAAADDYQHHYVIWTPATPKFCYCYNPTTKSYYGRWDIGACGKESCHLGKNPHGYYSIAKAQQKGTIAEIPETAFSPRTEAPRIPTDSGNPAPVAPPANNASPPQPATGNDPAADPATPPAATPTAPAATDNATAPPATAAAAPQANNNPQVQPPPDLPDDVLAAAGAN